MTSSYSLSSIPLAVEHEAKTSVTSQSSNGDANGDITSNQSLIFHCMLAGGLGGMIGDSVMHSLDTVKTRQQGLPHLVKYKNMIPAYLTIIREEGLFRGLYSGYGAAMLGSFPSTALFFGSYEFSKRMMINDFKMEETVSYFIAGIIGDLASSVFYVPSEVLKTRLQLQGRFNNPHTDSGYNYKHTANAVSSIIKHEGYQTLFYGYKQTLIRDLPFSALQLLFYEKFRQFAAIYHQSQSTEKLDELPISSELLTGAAAGGLAGTLTTPLDVIKTRIQTQNPNEVPTNSTSNKYKKDVTINTKSTFRALAHIYRNEGVLGMFSGVGPRFIWTGIQSSIMLLLYQVSLKKLDSMFEERERNTFA